MNDIEFLAPATDFEVPVDHTTIDGMELRCGGKLQGIIKESASGRKLLEIRCKEQRCAERGAGMVVLHYFDLETGELDHTDKFRDPRRSQKNEESNNQTR